MPTITFQKENKTIETNEGTILRKALLSNGFASKRHLHTFPLKNHCIVEITNAVKINKRSADEEALIRGNFIIANKVADNLRVACMVTVQGDMTITTSPILEKDPVESKNRLKFTLAVGGFGLLTLLALAYIVLDFVALI